MVQGDHSERNVALGAHAGGRDGGYEGASLVSVGWGGEDGANAGEDGRHGGLADDWVVEAGFEGVGFERWDTAWKGGSEIRWFDLGPRRERRRESTDAEDDFVDHFSGLIHQGFGYGFLVFCVALDDYQLGLHDVLLDAALGEKVRQLLRGTGDCRFIST